MITTITPQPQAEEHQTTIPHPHGPSWEAACRSGLDVEEWARSHIALPDGWEMVAAVAISTVPVTRGLVERCKLLAAEGLGQRAIGSIVGRRHSLVRRILRGEFDEAPDIAPLRAKIRVHLARTEYLRRTRLHAPPAVYAAAQLAGLRTHLDQHLAADYDGIQYYDSVGRPLRRECYWDGRASLPADVQSHLDAMRSITHLGSIGGHMRGRPNTGRAQLVAASLDREDSKRYAAARRVVQAWVRSNWSAIVAGEQ